ncbi:PAS domain-containing protein [Falsiroseomonas sp. HC035]|uniref:PAS domain-containing protein n=1 Tax=Falsiroseomonas sp. HC035 TaxID=3390999 RepID=UPI003D31E4B9
MIHAPPSEGAEIRPARGRDRARPRQLRFAALLLGLVLAVLLPTLAFGGIAAWEAVKGRQAAVENGLRFTAQSLSLALDREIDRHLHIVRGLAAAEALDEPEPDLARFDAQARRVTATFGTTALLLDAASLRAVVDTALPPGMPAGASAAAEFRLAAETRRPVVTDLVAGIAVGPPLVGVAVPVVRGNRIPFILAVRLDPEILRRLLAAPDLPTSSFAAVTDSRGVVVARSDALHSQRFGQTIPEENRRQLAAAPSGIYRAAALDGAEQVFGFHRLDTAPGWTVVAAQPAASFDAAWRAAAHALGTGALLALTLGSMLTILVARGVLVPVRRLEVYARRLAEGGQPTPGGSAAAIPPAHVAELEALRQGFAAAEAALFAREATLAEGHEKLRLALDAADLGTWRWEVAAGTDLLIWDARCRALFGLPRDAAVDYAIWAATLLDEDRAGAEAAIARALDPAEPEDGLALDYRVRCPDGTVRWLASTGRTVFVPDPAAPAGRRPLRILGVIRDCTAAREVAAALARSNEEALAAAERVQLALAAGAIVGTWDWDLVADRVSVDERFAEHFGIDPTIGRSGLLLEQVLATVHPADLPGLHAAIDEGLARGGPYRHEYRVRGRDGVYRWIEANGRVDLGPDGAPVRFPGILLDVEARRALEAERDRSAALLRAFVAGVPGVVYAKDRNGRMLVANAGTAALVGKPLDAILGRTDAEFLDDPAQAAIVMANDHRIMESGTAEQFEEAVSLPDGRPAVWLSTKAPFRNDTGEVVGLVGASVDITERKRAEERLRLMVHELNHRVKNTLATVQSIAAHSLRGVDPSVRRRLETRLLALAAAHDVLTREAWTGADVDEVVAGVLAPHGGRVGGRFRVSGPPLRLAPRAAMALSMALHELATNALKYGALSVPTGHVEVHWEVPPGPAPRFHLTWRERGGPTVAPPALRGFGTSLVERGLSYDLGGTARIDFAPEGLICHVEAPLPRVTAPAEVAALPRLG